MIKKDPLKEDVIKSMSPLEAFIVKSLNSNKKYSSSDIYNLIKKKKDVSKSSIPVILDRLYKKGILARETETAKGGIRFLYMIQMNREEFERSVVENTVNSLVKRFGEKAVVYFNESVAKQKRK